MDWGSVVAIAVPVYGGLAFLAWNDREGFRKAYFGAGLCAGVIWLVSFGFRLGIASVAAAPEHAGQMADTADAIALYVTAAIIILAVINYLSRHKDR